MVELMELETQSEYAVKYTNHKPKDGFFGRVTISKNASSLNSEHYAFNVTGEDYPRGLDRPQHSDRPPRFVWDLAVQKLYSLENGEDY